ncbi:DNA primase family protein [Aminipila sp.]|uniref:DNA primase family protein n=1 Tax=Aminipila sp. TaxID=2060095 RepID=UPI00289C6B22|nr:phage/plasmid primase, P4 family [Aminipila sp.]
MTLKRIENKLAKSKASKALDFDSILSNIKTVDAKRSAEPSFNIKQPAAMKQGFESLEISHSTDSINSISMQTKSDDSKLLKYNLANELIKNFEFICLDNNQLFCFDTHCFVELSVNSGITLLKKYLPEIIQRQLSSNDYKEILKQIATHPEIQRKSQKAKSNENAIVFKNGTFYIDTGEFIENFSPSDYCYNYIDHELDMEASDFASDVTMDYIYNICNGSSEIEQIFFEVCGYLLSNHNSAKAIFFLWGAPNSGKSTICNIIRKLIGPENCCSIPVQEFGSKHAIAELYGKKVCFDSDATGSVLQPRDVSNLKKATGNDLQLANKKYGSQFHFENTCKIMIASNNLLKISSEEDFESFYNRIVVLPFRNSVPEGSRDRFLEDKLLCDRNFLIRKSLMALTNLYNRDFVFSKVISTSEYMEMVASPSGHVNNFVKSRFTLSPAEVIPSSTFLQLYRDFCDEEKIPDNDRLKPNQLIPEIKNSFEVTSVRTENQRYLKGLKRIG